MMKKFTLFSVLLILFFTAQTLTAQNPNGNFKMSGPRSVTLNVNETYSSPAEILPFKNNINKIYGLAITADIQLESEEGLVRVLLVDNNYEEYLIYEGYSLLEESLSWSIDEICEETAIMEGVKANSVKIEIENATITLKNLVVSTQLDPSIKIDKEKKEKKQGQNEEKIKKINENLKRNGKNWIAGPTQVSELSFEEKKMLFGQSTFPPAFEYYAGGVISTSTSDTETPSLKSATASPYVKEWDWRNRHGKNWISPVTDQGLCGSCWSFAAAGATEAMVNLYFNQLINPDLSEQDLLSCSNAGSCSGGYPSVALTYITNTGIVDEAAFPYSGTDEPCQNKSKSPEEHIKISGRVDFGSSLYPRSEDNLKKMLIELGPISGGLYDWAHAMTLVGYKVVEEGDKFYYRDLNLKRYWITIEAGNPLIGKTVWIFKNSWSSRFGDGGYVYVETPITNMGWTHGLKTPVISLTKNYEVICEDKDGDGYYWWGLGEKPETCDCPDEPDGDDSDPTLGPIDEYGNFKKLSNVPVLVNVPENSDLGCNPELPTNSTAVKATGGCSVAPVVCVPGEIISSGCQRSQTFTYTATDECGNSVSATTTYTWTEDLTPPVLVNVPADQFLGSNPELPGCDPNVAAIDECGEATVSCLPGEIVQNDNERSQIFTYTATDICGNKSSATTTYTWTEELTLPVADFSASTTLITQYETVSFEDLSTGNPTSWLWVFENGTPATSTLQNPKIKFEKPGKQGITLTVTNADGSNTKTVENLITVNELVNEVIENPDIYCSSKGDASQEWIASVDINAQINSSGSSNEAGYQNFTAFTFTAEAGKNVNFSLNPGFLNRWQYQYWRIWIDYNQDGDFNDAGELVYTSSKSKGEVSGSFSVLPNTDLTTRMRIAMKRDAVPALCETFAYGEVEDYTIQITKPVPQPAVADFTANTTTVKTGDAVQFTDLSSNDPTQWYWQFPGGTPATSSAQNPTVTYNSAGEFDVILIVSKEGFEPSQKTVAKFVAVSEIVAEEYCTPLAVNSTADYMANISIENVLTSSAAGSGYSVSASTTFFVPGKSYSITLTPKEPTIRNYWRVWIDLNGDGDFTDADETLLAVNNKKGTVTSVLSIPQNATGETRMRIAMRNQSAPAPCDDGYNGEVKDFPVAFEVAPQARQLDVTSNPTIGEFLGVTLYPNPVFKEVTIRLNAVFSGDNYSVYNINGRKLMSDQILSETTTVDLSGNAPGIYLMLIQNNGQVFSRKVIKK